MLHNKKRRLTESPRAFEECNILSFSSYQCGETPDHHDAGECHH